MRALAISAGVVAMFAIAGLDRSAAPAGIDEPPATEVQKPPGTVLVPTPAPIVIATYQGHSAEWWARRAHTWHQQAAGLRRTLLHRPDVTEAINLACTIYGNCSTLWRKARCESKLYRYAANAHSSARGLFQFLTTGGKNNAGTWGTTPFAGFSVFSPYANALAAGWMHAVANRGGEWDCR